MDPDGYPAFIDQNYVINWKKQGQWTTLPGKAKGITIGGDGSIFKLDVNQVVHRYDDDTWQKMGQ